MRTLAPVSGVLLTLLAATSLAQNPPAANPPAASPPAMPRTSSPAGATVYFVAPADGAEVKSPVTIRFGLRGMGVAPAGVTFEATGHHHLVVDLETLPPDNLPLPNNENVRHFGLGQTETELTLPPGRHTLQLVLGDHLHIPHNPPVRSAKITITVVP